MSAIELKFRDDLIGDTKMIEISYASTHGITYHDLFETVSEDVIRRFVRFCENKPNQLTIGNEVFPVFGGMPQ